MPRTSSGPLLWHASAGQRSTATQPFRSLCPGQLPPAVPRTQSRQRKSRRTRLAAPDGKKQVTSTTAGRPLVETEGREQDATDWALWSCCAPRALNPVARNSRGHAHQVRGVSLDRQRGRIGRCRTERLGAGAFMHLLILTVCPRVKQNSSGPRWLHGSPAVVTQKDPWSRQSWGWDDVSHGTRSEEISEQTCGKMYGVRSASRDAAFVFRLLLPADTATVDWCRARTWLQFASVMTVRASWLPRREFHHRIPGAPGRLECRPLRD